MNAHKCDICGQPATIHDTAVHCGEVTVSKHYCRQHGVSLEPDTLVLGNTSRIAALATVTGWHNSLSDSEKRQLEMDYHEFRRLRRSE